MEYNDYGDDDFIFYCAYINRDRGLNQIDMHIKFLSLE